MSKKTIAKDVVIIGAGISGLTAALYSSRLELSTGVLENALIGGQISSAARVENYPGLESIGGNELASRVMWQAQKYGAKVDEFDEVERCELDGSKKYVETANYMYECDAVIVATGQHRRKLGLPEEGRFANRGVHYCEVCDGHMYGGKVIAVAGGGNAAVDAANFLTKYGSKVYLIHRSELRADESSQQKLFANEKVEVMLQTRIVKLIGESRLRQAEVLDGATGTARLLDVDGLFVNVGVEPNVELFREQLKVDERGFIVAGEDCKTNLAGVFAAGDVRTKEFRQLTTAAADGTVAALQAEKYIRSLRK
ncbi:MAG: FAD-dependent oxidoreductase [Selenomonadaceae bacterium]|nr:FAD-dependent oxidoreductase [Selenomonadaceae bacterium]